MLGFAYLTRVDTKEAKDAFEKAIEFDQADYLPRLGLGLAKIREGDLQEGRREIEIAASLDPNNSLVRSYLGKAYYEEKRIPLDEREYAIAKELDPKDPTPWFYDAIAKQTTNRPVEALQDMQKAIELNDNRAVYRSRLLLDSDLAARSASLGRIYSDLGFQQLGSGGRMEVGQHRSEQLFRPPISRRLLLCFAAPRDRQGQRTAPVSVASAAQHDAHSAPPRRKQPVPHQRRRSWRPSRSMSSIRCSTATGSHFRRAALSVNITPMREKVSSPASTKTLPSALAVFTFRQTAGEQMLTSRMTSPTPLFNSNSLPKPAFKVNTVIDETQAGELRLRFVPDDFLPTRRNDNASQTIRIGFRQEITPDSQLSLATSCIKTQTGVCAMHQCLLIYHHASRQR